MEQKLSFLLDRTQPFSSDRVQLLDQLTIAMNTNSPQVTLFLHRPDRLTKFGGD